MLSVQPPKSLQDPWLLTQRPFEELVAQHQVMAVLMKRCAIGCTIAGAAIMLVQGAVGFHNFLRRRALRWCRQCVVVIELSHACVAILLQAVRGSGQAIQSLHCIVQCNPDITKFAPDRTS